MSELTIDPTIVIPGDEITPKITPKTTNESSKVIIGPGLRREDKDLIVAVKCGQLVNRKNMIYWIDSRQKRYIACKGDRVIGFVTNKGSLSARLDIGTNETATLSLLAFPNATKRNKPAIEVSIISLLINLFYKSLIFFK
jgi:exosome complex component RRP40